MPSALPPDVWPAPTPASASAPPQHSPQPTDAPASAWSQKRNRSLRTWLSHPLLARQSSDNATAVADAKTQCFGPSSNDVLSCYPTAGVLVVQDEYTTFIWNSDNPLFTQFNLVDIALHRADSGEQVLFYPNTTNPRNQAGSLNAPINDSWWGTDGPRWDGTNKTFTYFWTIVDSQTGLDGQGAALSQSIFSAVQTTLPDSIIASSTSAAAASSRSQASASLSAAQASLTHSSQIPGATSSGNGGSVQSSSDSSSSFPDWAIAVIVILGFFAIVATGVLIFVIIRRIRRREQLDSNRNSMGSASPMMANLHNANSPQSPLLGHEVGGGIAGGAAAAGVSGRHSSGGHHSLANDAASTISRANSAGDSGPFSGADAAIMADAFRKALRKPDFAQQPVEEGDSPPEAQQGKLINRELAEEGRDIRSVSSSRGVKVETLSDSEDTVQDHH